MDLQIGIIALILCAGTAFCIQSNEVTESCAKSDSVCEFKFDVVRKQTMLHYDGALGTPLVSRNDVFFKHPKCDSDNTNVPATSEELAKVITVDGTYRHVHTVNGEYVGPSIVVHEGQTVVVHIRNKLFQESIGMHWHGMRMMHTNWMDGVSGLTQCGIQPHETFTYRFIASPAGTHWYHLHQGNQRTDGAFGALIVLPKNPDNTEPAYDKEFVAIINDFFPMDSNLAFIAFMANQKQFLWDNYNNTGQCYGGGDKAPDGASTATYRFYSALINGKGRRYDANGNPFVKTPMETYIVKANKKYRFRIINSAMTYAFRVSIDNHPMVILSSDGHDLKPVNADSVILNPGERFDFYITTNQTVGKYWVRVETFERTPHHTLAVLQYEGAAGNNDPTSTSSCMDSTCVVVNCPFKSFGSYYNARCINFEDLEARQDAMIENNPLTEYIMPFDKTRTIGTKKRNTGMGIQFTPPSTPPVVLGRAQYDDDCSKIQNCGSEPCLCTHQVNLKLGNTIQITMPSNTTHPMHLHGNPFQVVTIGYPEYDPTTNEPSKMNSDYVCNNDLCYNATWRNKGWYGGNIPAINLKNPPVKDTVAIPAGGYVVIRFKADNPGWWFVHCHLETHFLQGMALILQAGEDKDMVPPPKDFHKCGTFNLDQEAFTSAMSKRRADMDTEINGHQDSDGWTDREKRLAWGYVGVIILGLILGVIVHVLFVRCRD